MGVPAFFRWLTEKYPKVIEDVLEARVSVDSSGGIALPFDCCTANPSGLECDNFYIDMNGIIHPCSHPENGPQPKTEVEMYENVCRYVDRLFRAVRPRKLLYLAIDGVAPRAKMNQQRARRFRSAQEVREQNEINEKVRKNMKDEGLSIPEKKSSVWDSNVITPGTPFMKNLSDYIRFYIRKRMSEDKAWKKIKVIFSDASIPGEGEHKIMAHIRLQRTQAKYNPNLVHILHGLDADLIMLALATHEAHFYILREEVVFGRMGAEYNEKRKEQNGFKSKQLLLDEEVGTVAMALPENRHKPLVRLSIPILREYLHSEFQCCHNMPFEGEVSFEHVIDDVVFLCFFVGNDFLPHLPSLDIRDGGLDFLFNVYKRVLPTLGSYLTDHGGVVNLSNVDVILAEVGAIEDHVFNIRYETEKNNQERIRQSKERRLQSKIQNMDDPRNSGEGQNASSIPKIRGRSAQALLARKKDKIEMKKESIDNNFVALGRKNSAKEINKQKRKIDILNNAKAAEELKKKLKNRTQTTKEIPVKNTAEILPINDDDNCEDDDEENELFKDLDCGEPNKTTPKYTAEQTANLFKERVKALEQKRLDEFAKNVDDKVRLHEKGWKDRYYKDKCKAENITGGGGREHLFRSYIKGLCWVMKYYYDGVPSWKWYFPFHYAPFASDLKNIERFQSSCNDMDLSSPFSPVEQLLSVLPEDSSHAVPKASRWLMKDEESPIIDFYPKEILCDPNGKAMPWLWVVLLPFIDENRLLDALKPTKEKWSKYEHFCNSRGLDDGYLYMHQSHPLFPVAKKALAYPDKKAKHRFPKSDFNGTVRPPLSNEQIDLDSTVEPPSTGVTYSSQDGLLDQPIYNNECLCVSLTEPKKLPHKSALLDNSLVNPPTLQAHDLVIRRPRLNRGGKTIANMGGGVTNNHGGGMHVDRNFRNQINQNLPTGMRGWGTMEPSLKRPKHGNNNNQYQKPYRPNLFGQGQMNGNLRYNHNKNGIQQNGYGIAGLPQGFYSNQHSKVSTNSAGGVHIRFGENPQTSFPPPPTSAPRYHTQPPPQFVNQAGTGVNYSIPPPTQGNFNWNTNHRAPPPPPPPPPPPKFKFKQQRTVIRPFQDSEYNKRNSNAQQKDPNKSKMTPQLMQTLRSQLASTLQQNRMSGKRN